MKNEVIKFPIATKKSKKIYSILIMTPLVLYLFSFFLHGVSFSIVFATSFFLIIIIRILLHKSERIIINGEIQFDNTSITIIESSNNIATKISFEDIEEIVFWYIAFKGELVDTGRMPMILLSKGGDNEIKITTKHEIYTYNIYLESEPDAIRVKILNRFLKENEVNIKLKGLYF